MRARVIVSDEHGATRIAHDLFRDAILATVPAARRADLHAATGRGAAGSGRRSRRPRPVRSRRGGPAGRAFPGRRTRVRRRCAPLLGGRRPGGDSASRPRGRRGPLRERPTARSPRAPRTSSCCSPSRPHKIAPVMRPPHAASTREQPRQPGPLTTPPHWPVPLWVLTTWAAVSAPTLAKSPSCSPKPLTASPYGRPTGLPPRCGRGCWRRSPGHTATRRRRRSPRKPTLPRPKRWSWPVRPTTRPPSRTRCSPPTTSHGDPAAPPSV